MGFNISIFFFFFKRRYNPWWVLACFTISFHNLLSLRFSLQFLTFIFFRSSSTWSGHLSLGLPTGLDEHGSHSATFLTIRVVSILFTCAAHRNLCNFINPTIFIFSKSEFLIIHLFLSSRFRHRLVLVSVFTFPPCMLLYLFYSNQLIALFLKHIHIHV